MTTGSMRMMVGWKVFTSDGDEIGTVKEFSTEAFKVDAPMQPDFWLPMSTVISSGASRVELDFVKDHLGDYKLNEAEARSI